MTEREQIDRAQKAFASLKRALIAVEKISRDAGRNEAGNAAMGIYGKVVSLHSEATKELYTHFPSFADDVVALGPGGR